MRIVTEHMPHALRGIVFAGFMAAFMSTVATQLNWGASYLVADFYRRFVKKDGSEKHYVQMSRLATVLLVIVSAYVSAQLGSIVAGWEIVLTIGAGTGGVYLLRWYWWRINAWSEISAMATALVVSLALRWTNLFTGSEPVVFAETALTVTAATTLVWIVVTFLTKPEPEAVLLKFYRSVRPHVAGWKPVAQLAPKSCTQPAIWGATCSPGFWAAPWFTWRCLVRETAVREFLARWPAPVLRRNLCRRSLWKYSAQRLGRGSPVCAPGLSRRSVTSWPRRPRTLARRPDSCLRISSLSKPASRPELIPARCRS